MKWVGHAVQMQKCTQNLYHRTHRKATTRDLHGDTRILKLLEDRDQWQASN
jgi:hypothetical protein